MGMEITLNNRTKTVPDTCTVEQLLDEVVPGKQKGLAVAVNSQIIPRHSWEHRLIRSNDEVLIIKATQGG